MKKIFRASWMYAVLGLTAGVFYREYTKMMDYFEPTMLSNTHVHAITMGTLFFMIILVLNKLFNLEENKRFNFWFWFYNASFLGVLATMVIRGIYQVTGVEAEGFSHIAGTFHTFTAVALIWFMVIVKKAVFKKEG